MSLLLGIDPGMSGGLAVLSHDLSSAHAIAYAKITPHDIVEVLRSAKIQKAYIENVHAMPAQGVVSVWKFGQNYGWWLGVLTALGIPFEKVQPLKWQTTMRCRTGGDKNVSKAKAQELFPNMKITHAHADALLIAEYGRRVEFKEVL
jgi:crossover junction endodeoxyribonuclease RuvC